MKDAMRAKETLRLGTIRMLLAAIKQREIDERVELEDTDILSVVNKMIKQRRDACAQFTEAKRHDLADKEQAEITVLRQYLPKQLSPEEITTAVKQAVSDMDAHSIKDMGRVMSALKASLAGRADMGQVSQTVKQLLAG